MLDQSLVLGECSRVPRVGSSQNVGVFVTPGAQRDDRRPALSTEQATAWSSRSSNSTKSLPFSGGRWRNAVNNALTDHTE